MLIVVKARCLLLVHRRHALQSALSNAMRRKRLAGLARESWSVTDLTSAEE